MAFTSSPKPFYYEHIGRHFHLFERGIPVVFSSYLQMLHYVADQSIEYELIKVDLHNWQTLYEQGVFDCE